MKKVTVEASCDVCKAKINATKPKKDPEANMITFERPDDMLGHTRDVRIEVCEDCYAVIKEACDAAVAGIPEKGK